MAFLFPCFHCMSSLVYLNIGGQAGVAAGKGGGADATPSPPRQETK